MKKKILLTFLIVSVLACLFAIGVSAVDIDGIDYSFSGTSATITSANKAYAKENVVIPATVTYEGTTYTVTKIGEDAFYGNTTIKTLTFENVENIQSIGKNAFRDCSALTGAYEFTGLKTIGWYAFRNCATASDSYLAIKLPVIETIGGSGGDTHVFSYSGLKEIYIGNTINAINLNSFTDCKSLWKIEMQNGVKDSFSFSNYTFDGCTALKAFSIPEGTKKLPGRMFRNCSSLTAVYLPSTLTEINSGSQDHSTFANCVNMYFVSEPFTFTSDDDIPAKEDIYYFPSGLTKITDETFKVCRSLNKTLVFPEGITSVSNAWAFEAGINSPTLENIVFLGDMDKISTGSWKLTGKIYFANPNDKSSADFSSYSNSKSTVFCYAEGNTNHLAEKTVTIPAQCEIDAGVVTLCFCGHEISKDAQEGTALEHNLDYINGGATLVSVTYADFSKDGTKVVKCSLCNTDKEAKADKVFDYKGYSKNEKGGFCMGYLVNQDALKDYESKNGKVNYGFVASANNNAPLNADGSAKDNVVKADLTSSGYTSVDFILTAEDWTKESVAAAKISLNMYVIVNNAVKYITANGYSDTAEAYTYSDVA